MNEYFSYLQEHLTSKQPFVSVTLLEAKGSVPQIAGAKILVSKTGLSWGTIGGGKIEAKAIAKAQAMLHQLATTDTSPQQGERTLYCSWALQKDVGMTCGGGVKLFFEAFNIRPWTIAIFGAGHVAQELTKSLSSLDCRVLCFDNRPDWLSKLPQNKKLTAKHTENMAQEIAQLPASTFVVLMTQGHSSDTPILVKALNRGCFPFIGVIGSHSKAAVMKKELLGQVDANLIDSFHCPVGLKIGNNTPAEISISICAQLLQRRDEAEVELQAPINLRKFEPTSARPLH